MKYFVGVDVGGTTVKAGLVDENGAIVKKIAWDTHPERDSALVAADFALISLEVIKQAGVSTSDVCGIGVGIPGTVNPKKGVVSYSGNLRFRKVNVVKEMKKVTSLPVFIGNDANCAALGETKFGSGAGCKNALLVTLGTGVGTGFIVDGKILEGNNGEGAEGGHICIKIGGEKCSCGQRGCWEAYASATALIRQTEKMAKKHPESELARIIEKEGKISGRTAFIARKNGDKYGEKVVRDYVRYISYGIVNLVNVFRPDVVMVGGGVSHEGDYFIEMIERAVRRRAFGGKYNVPPTVVKASLGNDAGILGAAALSM